LTKAQEEYDEDDDSLDEGALPILVATPMNAVTSHKDSHHIPVAVMAYKALPTSELHSRWMEHPDQKGCVKPKKVPIEDLGGNNLRELPKTWLCCCTNHHFRQSVRVLRMGKVQVQSSHCFYYREGDQRWAELLPRSHVVFLKRNQVGSPCCVLEA
jgi:hypothetical protein